MLEEHSIARGCIGPAVVLLLLFGGCAYLFGDPYNKMNEKGRDEADSSWVPEGFTKYNKDIAWKWSASDTFSCTHYCTQIEIVSKKGCSRLYAEAGLQDDSNNNVGYVSATTGSLQPRQKALLRFDIFNDAVSTRLYKISCS